MGIISINNADHLFWLGRYTERVYTTIRLFSDSYDSMIDHCLNDYEDFCRTASPFRRARCSAASSTRCAARS